MKGNMKKILSVLLIIIMTLGVVACGGGDKKDDVKDTAETTEDGEKKTSVALLVSGNLGDMSFNDSSNAGLILAEKELGIDFIVIENDSDPSKYEPAVIEAAEAGYDMIFASSNFQEFFETHAPDFPEVVFVLYDAEVQWDLDEYKNVHCMLYKNNEGSFLGGYLAAKMTTSGLDNYNDDKIIGFLGGQDQPVINDFLVGYIEGAQYADPDIKIISNYSNSFRDSAKGKELGLAMINQKADISFNVAGGAGVGLIEASVENDAKVVGVDSDQALMFKDTKPEFAEAIPSSVIKDVGYSIYRAIEKFEDGTLALGETEYLGIKEGAMSLADNEYYKAQVPEEIRKELEEISEKISSGEIEVGTAYGVDNEEIVKLRNSVKP